MLSDLLLLLPALFGFVILIALRERAPATRGTAKVKVEDGPPANAIVVDGSNVMHWGDAASAFTVMHILADLRAKGYAPIVFFDANVGYVLGDRYYNEQILAAMIDTPAAHIRVVSKGVIADEAILAFATNHKLRVVTNDKYRDWRVRFPHAAKKGVLRAGTWRDGNVVWRAKLPVAA
jgi:hypothetical protein